MRVASPLAYVRLTEGGTVCLERGEPVPPGADPEHVDQLKGKGVLVDEGVEILDDHGKPIELAPLPDPVEVVVPAEPPPPEEPVEAGEDGGPPVAPAVGVDDAGKGGGDADPASPPQEPSGDAPKPGKPRPPRGGSPS